MKLSSSQGECKGTRKTLTLSQNNGGRTKVMGVKATAPINPMRSEKNGSTMATRAVITTALLRRMTLMAISLSAARPNFCFTQSSRILNTGWANTYHQTDHQLSACTVFDITRVRCLLAGYTDAVVPADKQSRILQDRALNSTGKICTQQWLVNTCNAVLQQSQCNDKADATKIRL